MDILAWPYLDGALALLIGVCFAQPAWRLLGLCLVYAVGRWSFHALMPSPAEVGHDWYLYCAYADAGFALAAATLYYPAVRAFQWACLGLILVHFIAYLEFPLPYTYVYNSYTWAVNMLEGFQVLALLWGTPYVQSLTIRAPDRAKEPPCSREMRTTT
jgi:hypothetical protein